MYKPKVVSIYSGCGGIDEGFIKAGFDVVFASDIWDVACNSLQINHPDTEVLCSDIQSIDFQSILQKHKTIDCLVGGPPCPPFSKSRFYRTEKSRGIDDESGEMTLREYFRGVKELNPSVFLFENVHGFVYRPHFEALEFLQKQAKELGYKISYGVVNAANYGVPQTRERFICVGYKSELMDFDYPKPTHCIPNMKPDNSLLNWVTCGDVLSDIDFDLPEDSKMQAGSKHKDLLKLIPPGDNYLFFTEERGYADPLFKWRSRYWSFLLKLSPNRPSWTIQASHSNNMGPFHWKNRFLRITEIKRIQTFPDDFNLLGSYREQWRQVGNAVPPQLAYIFANAIKNQYFYLSA
ncbi:MAG: DNA cytosine methyltransferase [Cytophagia bacterium]|nr:MAG: DNA cytosine methyltransferase [Cytophagales bacterium]TAG37419.1 MAG: DNA cytosine methyltransferase [Cytophagia bacterium]TAG78460.1 MAG: DNA cytosine methyltransferase [Cytophagales bacterium]